MSTREKWIRILGPLVLIGSAFVARRLGVQGTVLATLAIVAGVVAGLAWSAWTVPALVGPVSSLPGPSAPDDAEEEEEEEPAPQIVTKVQPGSADALWAVYKQRDNEAAAALKAAIEWREKWKDATAAKALALSAWHKMHTRPQDALDDLEKDAADLEASESLGETSYREHAKGGRS
jgi:hypothetical protein